MNSQKNDFLFMRIIYFRSINDSQIDIYMFISSILSILITIEKWNKMHLEEYHQLYRSQMKIKI